MPIRIGQAGTINIPILPSAQNAAGIIPFRLQRLPQRVNFFQGKTNLLMQTRRAKMPEMPRVYSEFIFRETYHFSHHIRYTQCTGYSGATLLRQCSAIRAVAARKLRHPEIP